MKFPVYVFCVFMVQFLPQATVSKETIYSTQSKFLTVASKPAFIDKTLMIKDVLDGPETILITAPRRFGKSTNLDMLKQFLMIPLNKFDSNNRLQTFQRLKIYKYYPKFVNKMFGRYPVLHVALQIIFSVTNYDDAIKTLANKVHKSFCEHIYLRDSIRLDERDRYLCDLWSDANRYLNITPCEVMTGLSQLVEVLYKHYNNSKVFVLIDEYDAVITSAMLKVSYNDLQLISELLALQISNLVLSNELVERVVVTGISYVTGTQLSGLINIFMCRFLSTHSFVKYYGFTEPEVQYLFNKFNVSRTFSAEATEWYDGYVSQNGIKMFNPYSILLCLETGVIDNYWKNSGRVQIILNAFAYPCIEESIMSLLRNEHIKIKLVTDTSVKDLISLKNISLGYKIEQSCKVIFFSCLFEQGYLTTNGPKKPNHLSIPNLELKMVFSSKLRNVVAAEYNIDPDLLEACTKFFDDLNYRMKSTDIHFVKKVNKFQSNVESLFDSFRKSNTINTINIIKNEASFEHKVFTVLLLCNTFQISDTQSYKYYNVSEATRISRLNLSMRKNNIGVIIEVKLYRGKKPNSRSALKQILKMNYDTVFELQKHSTQKVQYKLFVGLSINNDGNVSVSCLLNTKNESYAVTVPQISYSHKH